MIMQSDALNELATALSKAQSKIKGAIKDSENPFFKSHYADLASVREAAQPALTEFGLSVVQTTTVEGAGEVWVVTTLLHSSGQWIRGWYPARTEKEGPQALGAAVSYARRYALASILNIPQIDDDAESAVKRDTVKWPTVAPKKESYGAPVTGDKFKSLDRALTEMSEPPFALSSGYLDQPKPKNYGSVKSATESQQKMIYAKFKDLGYTEAQMNAAILDATGKFRRDLTMDDIDPVIAHVKKLKEANGTSDTFKKATTVTTDTEPFGPNPLLGDGR